MTDKQNTGGPAFASQLEVNRDGYAVTGGMTLRDYFAAKAMQSYWSGPTVAGDLNTAAAWAYDMADAMLEARDGKP